MAVSRLCWKARSSALSASRAGPVRRMVRSRGWARRCLSKDCCSLSFEILVASQRWDMGDESRLMPTSSTPPSWLQALGWLSLPGMVACVSRLVYEQTVLTWRDGEQMVGFALAHAHVILLVWMMLSAVLAIVYLLSVAFISVFRL